MNGNGKESQSIIEDPETVEEYMDNAWNGRKSAAWVKATKNERLIPTDEVIVYSDNEEMFRIR